MAWETVVAGVVILSLAVTWYGLQAVALSDLRDRPRVRGDNKLLWAFVILCVPYVGALGYLSMGPTSFLPRPARVRQAQVGAIGRPVRSTARPPVQDVDVLAPVPHVRATGRIIRDNPISSVAPATGRERRTVSGLAIDPIIGTDSASLVQERTTTIRRTRPAAVSDAIRWPGSGAPTGWQHADADLHD